MPQLGSRYKSLVNKDSDNVLHDIQILLICIGLNDYVIMTNKRTGVQLQKKYINVKCESCKTDNIMLTSIKTQLNML